MNSTVLCSKYLGIMILLLLELQVQTLTTDGNGGKGVKRAIFLRGRERGMQAPFEIKGH